MIALFAALLLASTPTPAGTIDVPYMAQTEDLCGGAAAAMVFRYWGDRHADTAAFAPLVDHRAGGIANDVLVEAIRRQRWDTLVLKGGVEMLRAELAEQHPVIALIEARRQRYHYVVILGIDNGNVIMHDPAWGPFRRVRLDAFIRSWNATAFWGLVVLPSVTDPPANRQNLANSANPSNLVNPVNPVNPDPCASQLRDAVAEIGTRGLGAAEEILDHVRVTCPASASVIAEMAGIRFAQQRWREAESLAAEAVERDPATSYGWDVLGSSRFMQDDEAGALAAWNRVGKPVTDSVAIDGLTHTRYALLANVLPLAPNALLTEGTFRLAERRLEQLPSRVSSRINYRPDGEGFATVQIAMTEHAPWPHGPIAWMGAGAEAAANREMSTAIPGWTGLGDVWTASWRWWSGRPRVALSFAAPRIGRWPGVWRVDGSWEAQTYASATDTAPRRQTLTHTAVSVSNWLTPNLRYEVNAGADSWDGTRQAVSAGGAIEGRAWHDRLAAVASGTSWFGVGGGAGFRSGAIELNLHTSRETRGLVGTAAAGVQKASGDAPLSVWPGAGDGHARPLFLRAHPLLEDGIITGPAFGHQILYSTAEGSWWFAQPALARLGLATFVDAAHAGDRLTAAPGDAFQVDAGIGLRVRVPGRAGTLRVDVARGLRDGRNAVTFGWTR